MNRTTRMPTILPAMAAVGVRLAERMQKTRAITLTPHHDATKIRTPGEIGALRARVGKTSVIGVCYESPLDLSQTVNVAPKPTPVRSVSVPE